MKQNSYASLIKQIHNTFQRDANNSLRSDGLTLTQLNTLMLLEDAPEHQLSLRDLNQVLHVAQATVSGIISRLKKKGLIELYCDESDRRVKLVRVTPAGLELARRADQHRSSAEDKIFSCLTEPEKMVFYDLLQRICRDLPQQI